MPLANPILLLLTTTTTTIAAPPPAHPPNLILLNPSTSTPLTQPPLLNLSSPTLPAPHNSTSSLASVKFRFPHFVDTVSDAVFRTTSLYPTAVFVGAKLSCATGPTTNPDELTDVQLIFNYHVGEYRSVFINMEEWGQWSTPYPTTIPLNPSYGPLPIDLGMDVTLASVLLRASGYMDPFETVGVKWPVERIPRAMQQVFYYFVLEGEGEGEWGVQVAVGARDGSVRRVGGRRVRRGG